MASNPNSDRPSSFDFLARFNADLALHADRALTQFADGDYNTCLLKLRQFGELLTRLHEGAGRRQAFDQDQSARLRRLKETGIISNEQYQQLDRIRYRGNKAAHEGLDDQSKTIVVIRDAWDLAIGFYRVRTGERTFSPGAIRLGRGSVARRQELQQQVLQQKRLIEQERRERASMETREAGLQREIQTLKEAEAARAKALQSEKQAARSRLAKVKRERKSLQRQLEAAERDDRKRMEAEDAVLLQRISELEAESTRRKEELEGLQSSASARLAEAVEKRDALEEALGSMQEREGALAGEVEALKEKLADVEQRMDDLRAVPTGEPATEAWRGDWQQQYPDDWADVPAFFEERLLEGLPPFDRLMDAEHAGEGRWGRTWLCTQGGYGGPVKAVKIVRPPTESGVDSERSRRQWEREVKRARHASQVSHPNVVRIDEFAPEEHPGFVVLEGVTGETLADRLTGARLPEPKRIAAWLRQLASALQTLWNEGVPFTDLHTGNVMIDSAGSLKLFDVGFCRPQAYEPPEWRGLQDLREEELDVRSEYILHGYHGT